MDTKTVRRADVAPTASRLPRRSVEEDSSLPEGWWLAFALLAAAAVLGLSVVVAVLRG